MIDENLLYTTALAIGALAVLVTLLWLGHAVYAQARERVTAPSTSRAVSAVARGLATGDLLEATAVVRRLPAAERTSVLVEMAATVAGEQRRRLDELATRSGVRHQALKWARSRRWSRRLRGARLLALFGTGDEMAGDLLLRDTHDEVRAQAAEWAGRHPDEARVERLVEMLGDRSPRCRFAAREALTDAGLFAAQPLRDLLQRAASRPADPPPGISGALEVAANLGMPEFVEPALPLLVASEPGLRARAARVVAAAGGSRAAPALVAALRDPDADVRAAAASGLGDLGHWNSAAAVAPLLRDPSWRVGSAAATALTRMGPTGELFLRRAARTSGSGEADMALRELGAAPPAADGPGEAPRERAVA